MTDPTPAVPKTKAENLILNLIFNVGVPTLIMSKASGPHLLGTKWGLLVALLFPLGYGIYDFIRRRRLNFISAIGFASVLITGGFGLFKLDGIWFAVKDGEMPQQIGLAVLASLRAKEPLIHEILFNPQVIDVERVNQALTERGNHAGFATLMHKASYLIAAAMLVSAGLNYGFARWIIVSPPDTEAFNAELGKMHWISMLGLSIPTVAIMMFALWQMLKGLEPLTGLKLDDILRQPPEQKKAAPETGAADDQTKGGS